MARQACPASAHLGTLLDRVSRRLTLRRAGARPCQAVQLKVAGAPLGGSPVEKEWRGAFLVFVGRAFLGFVVLAVASAPAGGPARRVSDRRLCRTLSSTAG